MAERTLTAAPASAHHAGMQIDTPTDARTRPIASRRTVLRALGCGVAFDILLFGQSPGVGFTVFVATVAVLLVPFARDAVEDRALLVAAVAFAVVPAVRANESLIALSVLSVLCLLALAVAPGTTELLRAGVRELLRRVLAIVLAMLRAPTFVLEPAAHAIAGIAPHRLRSATRVVFLVVPVLVVFAALLASADRVFGELLSVRAPEWNAERLIAHLLFFAIGAGGFATLARASTSREAGEVPPVSIGRLGVSLRRHEWITLLTGICILFTMFVAVQFTFLFGGAHRVEVTPGLTYAEYARSGFFQLIAVAVLTFLTILATWDLGAVETQRDRAAFRGLVATLIGLTFVILASAWMRLDLYADAFGFTLNRYAAWVTIALVGVVLVIIMSAIVTGARDRVVPVSLAAAFAALLIVSFANPERFIAERNLDRYRATGKLDTHYLSTLGSDAVPALTGAFDTLSTQARLDISIALCSMLEEPDETGWRSANLARARAADALTEARLTPQTCERLLKTSER